MFGWLSRKKEVERLKEDTRKGFDSVKKDINSVGGWIQHLNSEKDINKKEIKELKEEMSSVKEEIEEVRNILSFMNQSCSNSLFKTPKQVSKKQTAVQAGQTPVQTGVQTPDLNNFSLTERAVLWVLLNTDMKLSYDDIASVLGKEKSTIRGQINTIKQKNENLIEESISENGKKRVHIPEKIKEKMLKKSKVRVKKGKKGGNKEESEENLEEEENEEAE